jgi:pimeloyl-ACP methyl ester carboxylesterase
MGMSTGPIVTSHVVVGGLLHLAMSIGAGIAFALALALLIRVGMRILANPTMYILGGAAGGALLYVIMMEAVAPSLNRTIVDFTPRTPFFLAHLTFGAIVAAWVYWRTVGTQVHLTVRAGSRRVAA